MAQNGRENRKSKPKLACFAGGPGCLSIPQRRGRTNWQSVSHGLVVALASREIGEATHDAKQRNFLRK